MSNTGTYTTSSQPSTAMTLDHLERISAMLRDMPPEPMGEWMRANGHPPEQFDLILPAHMKDKAWPVALPSYVLFSQVASAPMFMRRSAYKVAIQDHHEITEVKQFSEYGKFAVGDYVTRDGSDVQIVKDMSDDGFCGTFVCVVAPSSGWCAVGDDEYNLCHRYERVEYKPS